MALYQPAPNFSKSDKRLLALMAKLLLGAESNRASGSNLPNEAVILSDNEADELAADLEELIQSRSFAESAYFVESLTQSGEDQRAREIYLSRRAENGRTRIQASLHWSDFKARLGLRNSPPYPPNTRTMELSYFKRMERKLLHAAGIDPRVADIIMNYISSSNAIIEDLRSQKRALSRGIIQKSIFEPLISALRQNILLPDRQISSHRIVGAMTIIIDTGVLFTTRDWSVTGTISTMAGAATATLLA